jgi:AmmeMemoRadiSam system protein B
MSAIRAPAVAGTFYPADPGRLRTMVEGFLAAAEAPARSRPKAVIAPHAGYVYSGPVAGAAFATIGTDVRQIRRVVVIGPAHFVAIRGIAVPTCEAFRTPLGKVPLERAALDALEDLPSVRRADASHAPEHALEVELPFFQVALGEFALVPLLVGEARPAAVAEVLARVWGGPETLIVISSDLSHHHPYRTAQRRDEATARAIERLDDTALGPDAACGHLPIAGLLLEAGRRGLSARRLDLRNSGDTAGTRDSVVGYGAWAFGGD